MTSIAIPSGDQGFAKSSVLAAQAVRRSALPRARIDVSTSPIRSFQVDLAEGSLDIEVMGDEPDWLYKVLDTIQEFSSLPVGWDSYEGEPLTFEAAFASLTFLSQMLPGDSPAPSIVPGSAGGLQFEWHRAVGDLEVTVSRDGEISASFASESGSEAWDMESGGLDLARLHSVIANL